MDYDPFFVFFLIVLVIVALLVTVMIFAALERRRKEREKEEEYSNLVKQRAIQAQLERERAEASVKNYETKPLTSKVANIYANAFIRSLSNSCNRDITKKTVELITTIHINSNEDGKVYTIRANCTLIDFVKENLQPPSHEEARVFALAVSNKTVEIIKEKYPKDESGTEYNLEVEMMGDNISIAYTAPNGFYEPPKAW